MSDNLTQMRCLIESGRPTTALRRHVVDLIDEIAAGKCAFRALLHPLGFVYVPLLRGPDWTLRLHIWDTARVPASPIFHAHTWDLTSYVLHGGLENQLVHADTGVSDPAQRIYRVVGHGDVDEFIWTDKTVRAEVESSEQVFTDQIYRMTSGSYHTTINPAGSDLVTVALAERVPGTEEQVLGPLDGSSHSYIRLPCPADLLQSHAACVLEKLA